MKRTRKQVIVMGIVSFVILAAVLGIVYLIVCLNGGFGNRSGNVFSLSNFDAEAKSVLAKCLRITPSNEIQFKHASMVGGKDWTLYICFEASKADWESVLKTVSFTTRKGQGREVCFEMPALPWWKVEKEKVSSILCATEGYAVLVVVNEGEVRRVFIYTDGGPFGFPQSVWKLFKSQQ